MSFGSKITTTERHDVVSGCNVLETSSGSSLRGSQTKFASPLSPYDGHHASLTRDLSLQAHATVQRYPIQRLCTLHRKPLRPFQRSSPPGDGMREGIALQPEEEGEAGPNAAWKKQVRADRLALNALVEANQGREANAVPDKDGGNEDSLSDFDSRYQEYLGRRGLSNTDAFTRHMERLFDEL